MTLPEWPGAAAAYRKAYKILEHMAQSGHVAFSGSRCVVGIDIDGKYIIGRPRIVSQEMQDFISALNEGDEEKIKALNLEYMDVIT